MPTELEKAMDFAKAQLDKAVDKLRQQSDLTPSPRERLERAFTIHLGPGLYLPDTVEPSSAASPPLKRLKETEEDEPDSAVPSTAHILVKGQRRELREYLKSDEFIQYSRSVTYCRDKDIDKTALPVGLRTKLQPWQLQGQHKLCQLADGPWRGGWLADAVGLGKSLTALVAALRIKNEKGLKGFVLVVCPKQCVPQWYQEVQKHWTLENRPRAIILDKATYPVEALLQHDIVICSYSFLRNRYREADDHDLYVRLRTEFSPQRAAEMMPEYADNRRISKPLHSSLYSALNASIAVAILDESQTIKNVDAMVTKSVCSLDYHYAFALTGTPLFNQWKDVTGQLMAFPGYPFESTTQFLSIFGDGQSIRQTARDDLNNFLASIMVARPQEVLKKALLGHIVTEVEVILDDPMLQMQIEKDVKNAKRFLSEAGKKGQNPKEAASLRLSGYAALTKAQCRSACPALLRGRDDIPDEVFVLMRDDDDSPTAEMEEGALENLLRLGEPIVDVTSDAFGGEDDDEIADPTYHPEVGDLDLDDDGVAEDDKDDAMDVDDGSDNESSSRGDPPPRTYDPLPPQKRGEWLEELRGMPQEKISSPRITTILNLLRTLLENFRREKIIIVSRSVKFLDVLKLNIANQSVTETTEFHGFVAADERNENLRQFSREDGGPMVLLLSANAGGAGLNIMRASRTILCEPQWSSGAVIQIRGRNLRLGQTRFVHYYDIVANCAIDNYLKELLQKKQVSNDSLMAHIVRPDQEPWFAASPTEVQGLSAGQGQTGDSDAVDGPSPEDGEEEDGEEGDDDIVWPWEGW